MTEQRTEYVTTPTVECTPIVRPETLKDRAARLMERALGEGRPFIMIFEGGKVRAFYLDNAGMIRS